MYLICRSSPREIYYETFFAPQYWLVLVHTFRGKGRKTGQTADLQKIRLVLKHGQYCKNFPKEKAAFAQPCRSWPTGSGGKSQLLAALSCSAAVGVLLDRFLLYMGMRVQQGAGEMTAQRKKIRFLDIYTSSTVKSVHIRKVKSVSLWDIWI